MPHSQSPTGGRGGRVGAGVVVTLVVAEVDLVGEEGGSGKVMFFTESDCLPPQHHVPFLTVICVQWQPETGLSTWYPARNRKREMLDRISNILVGKPEPNPENARSAEVGFASTFLVVQHG